MNFRLTSSQQSAIQTFEDFLKNDNQVLRGAAGTGKTTLLKEFIAILQKEHRSFGLMAPTGRAAHPKNSNVSVEDFDRILNFMLYFFDQKNNKWRSLNQAFPDIKLEDQLKMLQDKFK